MSGGMSKLGCLRAWVSWGVWGMGKTARLIRVGSI